MDEAERGLGIRVSGGRMKVRELPVGRRCVSWGFVCIQMGSNVLPAAAKKNKMHFCCSYAQRGYCCCTALTFIVFNLSPVFTVKPSANFSLDRRVNNHLTPSPTDILNKQSSLEATPHPLLLSEGVWLISLLFFLFFCSKTTQRNKQIAMGRKKFNMDPKKVRLMCQN